MTNPHDDSQANIDDWMREEHSEDNTYSFSDDHEPEKPPGWGTRLASVALVGSMTAGALCPAYIDTQKRQHCLQQLMPVLTQLHGQQWSIRLNGQSVASVDALQAYLESQNREFQAMSELSRSLTEKKLTFELHSNNAIPVRHRFNLKPDDLAYVLVPSVTPLLTDRKTYFDQLQGNATARLQR